jgi:hypothetical protein
MTLKKSSQKDEERTRILRRHAFPYKSRALILLDIAEVEVRDFLLEASRELDFSLVVATGSPEEK